MTDLESKLEAAFERIEELETVVEKQQQTIEDLEADRDQLQERVAELEGRPTIQVDEYDELPERYEDTDLDLDLDDIDHFTLENVELVQDGKRIEIGKTIAGNMDDLYDLEGRVEDFEDPATDAGVDELQEADDNGVDLLPIQEISRLPESVAQAQLTENDLRARFLWRDFVEYSKRCPGGRAISSSELRKVLQAAEPIGADQDGETNIESKTVKRVMERIVDYTRDVATIRKNGTARTLYVPDDWRDQGRDAAADASVSPTNG